VINMNMTKLMCEKPICYRYISQTRKFRLFDNAFDDHLVNGFVHLNFKSDRVPYRSKRSFFFLAYINKIMHLMNINR